LSNLTPTPKAASAGIAGAVTYIIIRILTRGFHFEITAEDGAAITTIVAFIAAYLAPRSQPTTLP
jgi:hypothetical protein